jgi:DNA-binding MarR family transcriptional regulator
MTSEKKLKFTTEKSANDYLNDTSIPNIFLMEYLPTLSGDQVRVYLYAYVQSSVGDPPLSNESIARELGMKTQDVHSAWSALEEQHLIKRRYRSGKDGDSFSVTFVNLKNEIFAEKNSSANARLNKSAAILEEESVRDLYKTIEGVLGRPLAAADYAKTESILSSFDLDVEIVSFAVKHASANPTRPFHMNNVKNLLEIITSCGATSVEDAEDCLTDFDVRHGWHKQIMKALGLHGQITEEEKRIFNLWMDVYGLTIDDILHKAKLATGKGDKFSYLRKILDTEAEKSGKLVENAKTGKISRKKYYEQRQKRAEKVAEEKRSEVYKKIPQLRGIDEEIARLGKELSLTRLSDSGNRKKAEKDISNTLLTLTENRRKSMEAAGFDKDYTDIVYECRLCGDTGTREDGSSCGCFEFPKKDTK